MMNLLQANSEEINKRLSIRILLTFRCQDSSNFVYVQQPQAILNGLYEPGGTFL